MRGLELDYGVVKKCIDDIQKLPVRYPTATRPGVSGKGQGINQLEYLADMYVAFYAAWERLSEDTVNYLENMIADFQTADKQKAEKQTVVE